MNSPRHLQHLPYISVNNYDQKDGHFARTSDAKALSIGRSQYDESEISLKVWRHSGKRWSRQSEELPLHRNLDLNILLIQSLIMCNKPSSELISNVTIDSESAIKKLDFALFRENFFWHVYYW